MDNLDLLAQMWSNAKQKEDAARDERVDIEKKILAMRPAKEEGSESFKTSTGVKITLTGKIIYKANVEQLQALTRAWPDDARPIKVEVKADESKLKAIRQNRPDLWKTIAGAVETRPAKTNVAIEFKE